MKVGNADVPYGRPKPYSPAKAPQQIQYGHEFVLWAVGPRDLNLALRTKLEWNVHPSSLVLMQVQCECRWLREIRFGDASPLL